MIYAIIRGYGVNNDGSDKIGFTAPSAEGQADAISAAIAHAGVDPPRSATSNAMARRHRWAIPSSSPA